MTAEGYGYSREVDAEVTGAPLPAGVVGIAVTGRAGRELAAALADDGCEGCGHRRRLGEACTCVTAAEVAAAPVIRMRRAA